MYNAKGTIESALKEVQSKRWVLPAIQREFVWRPEQICRLFDSLLRGYPFGTFLFWRVPANQSHQYRFYDFVRDYHERDAPHCPDHPTLYQQELLAILDGQQRLTALNIGLFGSMTVRDSHKWRNNPNAYPKRILCLDLLGAPSEQDQEGEEPGYGFAFKKKDETGVVTEDGRLWFPASKVMDLNGGPDMYQALSKFGLSVEQMQEPFNRLDRLFRAVRQETLIHGYEERDADLSRVLSIFIRMNSGGTALSYSDLLLSIAVAQWSTLDARREIHDLVDELNQIGLGFALSHDFVLKAGLMLTDIKSVGFKVENFTNENMAILENGWGKIRDALTVTVQLAASFGLNSQVLRAESALLPIAYYIHKRRHKPHFVDAPNYAEEREEMRGWLVRSLLKPSGIWGSGLDTLLTALRDILKATPDEAQFPTAELSQAMAARGKALTFSPEEIDELLDVAYGDRNKRTFLLLSLLYPHLSLKNHFHIDHVFPKSAFHRNKLKALGFDSGKVAELQDRVDRLPNLQLLEGLLNNAKLATLPKEWLKTFPSDVAQTSYCQLHDLGDIPADLTGFTEFYDKRRELMKAKVTALLGATPSPD